MNVSFRPGEMLGRYTVVAPIGAGGMGEVYKAVDPTLDRTVALKILPPELVRNDERVRRFVQEAKSASSLTHPHIVTIYEIGTASLVRDTTDADGKPLYYIAMELVDGPTLKYLIHQERTDLRTLVRYLAQAADGLAKAHAAGIVHRDLKPENIVVSKDRFAKVLDFGLAKLTERTEGSDVSASRTAVREQTRDGIVVGTVGYMSPEQVQARPVDYRSDIFSFGCILYEAASRHKPFVADSDVDVMHKIVHDKPEPLDAIVPPVPAELRRIIRRCLAKEPEKRFQSMKDLAIDLAEIDEQWDELSQSSSSGSGTSAAVALPRRMNRRTAMALIAGVVVLLGLAGAAAWRWGRPGPVAKSADSFSTMKIAPITVTGDVNGVTISPDGKYLAAIRSSPAGFDIRMRQLATGSDVAVFSGIPKRTFGLTFSRDGNYLYYCQDQADIRGYSTLFQVPALGGRPRKVLFDIDSRPSFSADGRQMVFVRGNPPVDESYLMMANADGTAQRRLVTLKAPERLADIDPAWAPDGKTVVAFVVSDTKGFVATLYAFDVSSGKRTQLAGRGFVSPAGATWLPDGKGVVVAAADVSPAQPGQLWLLSWPEGEVRRITNDLTRYGAPSLTADGKTLATTQARGTSLLWRQTRSDAEPRQIESGSNAIGQLAASSQAIYFSVPAASGVGIWAAGLDGSDMRSIVGDGVNFDPAVPADGRFIVYVTLQPNGNGAIMRAERDGTEPHTIVSGVTLISSHIQDIDPRGEWFVYSPSDPRKLMKMQFAGGPAVQLSDRYSGGVRVAPDGKSILASVWEAGNVGRGGRIFHLDGSESGRFELRGGDYHWTADSSALTYLRDVNGVTNVWRQPLDGGPSTQVTHFTSGRIVSHVWTGDGTLLLGKGELTTDAVVISDFR